MKKSAEIPPKPARAFIIIKFKPESLIKDPK